MIIQGIIFVYYRYTFMKKSVFSLFILIVFLAGLYFYIHYKGNLVYENMDNPGNKCANLLVQKGSKFYLYNTKVAEVPGVNPIIFDNLEDYSEFLDWQKSVGIRCPVLYVQDIYDAQGNRSYKMRPDVHDLQGGLPEETPMTTPTIPDELPKPITSDNDNSTLLVDATQDDQPYNKNSYPAYDQSSYYEGVQTPLDQMDQKQQAQKASPNAMDPNWGGTNYTQQLVDKGAYKGNEVKIAIP